MLRINVSPETSAPLADGTGAYHYASLALPTACARPVLTEQESRINTALWRSPVTSWNYICHAGDSEPEDLDAPLHHIA